MVIPKWIKAIKNPAVSKKNYIPIYAPFFFGNEKKYVNRCLEDGWISPKASVVNIFEKKFAKYCHSSFALSCSSGTAALQLSLAVLGIKPGDEVIIPTFTMISTALAVSYLGAKICFADCDLNTGNITVDNIEKYQNRKTKVIIPVDIYGCPYDVEKIMKFAKEKNIHIVEDAAQAIGSQYNNKMVGSFSHLTTFSLYINKIVTTGQGGMITTQSKSLYQKLKRLNNYYFSPVRHFWHEKVGYNLRLPGLQAAVGIAQLENINTLLNKKRQIAKWYNQFLNPLEEYIFALSVPINCQSNYWQIAYRFRKESYNVTKLRVKLGKHGIETRTFFIPLHLQPAYYKKEYLIQYPNALILAKTGLLLPSGPSLTINDVKRICSIITEYLKK